MSTKEITQAQHATFLATYQGAKGLTQTENTKHVPPLTLWSSDRGQVLTLIQHDPKGDRYFVCQQYDNKTTDGTKDTQGDAAMKAATGAIGITKAAAVSALDAQGKS